jgi:Xaa-Pro aminopeptidase
MTRTVAIGPVSKELTRIYETVLKAQLRALDIIKPGAVCSDVDKEARSFIDTLYPGAFGHGLGHSVGLEIHEKPVFTPRCDTVLQPGHVMTVEPGIYIPGLGGCRIEDMVILTDSGYHNLISAPKELIIL